MAASSPQPHAYVAHLRRWDEDEMLLAARQVEGLIAHPGWQQLQRLIDEAHGTAIERLLMENAGVDGTTRPYEDLTRLLGFLSGLHQGRLAADAFGVLADKVRRRNDPEGDE